jgi:NADH dehydrogenase/NADH:ubiquinone oxidoreductase subunit G
MATLQEIYNLLGNSPNVLEWKVLQDIGSKVVINATFVRDDVAYQKNIVLLVKDRGQATETVYWLNGKPVELFPAQSSTFSQQFEANRDNVLAQINGLVKVSSIAYNDQEGYAMITAFVDNGDGTVSEKRFIVYFDANGNPVVKEVR